MQNIAPKKACNQMRYLGRTGQSGEEKPRVRSESGAYRGASQWGPTAALVDNAGSFLAQERCRHVPSAAQRQTTPRRRLSVHIILQELVSQRASGAASEPPERQEPWCWRLRASLLHARVNAGDPHIVGDSGLCVTTEVTDPNGSSANRFQYPVSGGFRQM